MYMNPSIYPTEKAKPLRIMVGYLCRCNECRDKTKSGLWANDDYINDGVKKRICIVCKESFDAEPVFEVLHSKT